VRTVWVPIQTTERDKTRPVIESHPVWEVIEDGEQKAHPA
jgi:hypothetical protein